MPKHRIDESIVAPKFSDTASASPAELVQVGEATTVDDVVLGTVEERRLAVLRESLDPGLSQAEAGQVVQGTPADFMARVHERHGIFRTK